MITDIGMRGIARMGSVTIEAHVMMIILEMGGTLGTTMAIGLMEGGDNGYSWTKNIVDPKF
ncbi:MAG: hypothetical protein WCG19_08180 [Chlorobiaceae bacterium]